MQSLNLIRNLNTRNFLPNRRGADFLEEDIHLCSHNPTGINKSHEDGGAIRKPVCGRFHQWTRVTLYTD